jgi:hypothetical protein
MALYVVAFTEHGGSRCPCRIRAAAGVDHITLAVQKIWGARCYWSWMPGSDTDGRVYERVGDAPDAEDIPRTGRMTVSIVPAQRRARE